MPNRKIPKKLYIYTNGEKTEYEYFRLFKDYLKKQGEYQLIVKPAIKGNFENLVNQVSGSKKPKKFFAKDGDEIWLVFDIDNEIVENPNKFSLAIENAKSKKFNLAWSNECFELWFLLHFQDLKSGIPRCDYHQKLKQFCRKESFEYHKNQNIDKLFELLKDRIPTAIKNAKKIDINNPSKSPSTKVYKIIEKLGIYHMSE